MPDVGFDAGIGQESLDLRRDPARASDRACKGEPAGPCWFAPPGKPDLGRLARFWPRFDNSPKRFQRARRAAIPSPTQLAPRRVGCRTFGLAADGLAADRATTLGLGPAGPAAETTLGSTWRRDSSRKGRDHPRSGRTVIPWHRFERERLPEAPAVSAPSAEKDPESRRPVLPQSLALEENDTLPCARRARQDHRRK